MQRYETQDGAMRRALAEAHARIDWLEADGARKDEKMADMRKEMTVMGVESRRKDAEIELYKKMLEDAGIKIKKLESSEKYHDGPNVPTSTGSLTMRQMQRQAVETRRAASTGRGPGREAGHEAGHEGTTAKIAPGAPSRSASAGRPGARTAAGRT